MALSKKSKYITAAALALAISAGGVTAINAQTAATTTSARPNPMSSLVSAIATKFNLNTADVQTVVDETMQAERTKMEAERSQEQATRLAQAVTDGKLTQAQADLITAKATELKTQMEADRTADQSLTAEQRKTKMETRQTELKAWATSNNIPEEYLRFVGGGKGFGGGHAGPRGEMSIGAPTQTPSATTSS